MVDTNEPMQPIPASAFYSNLGVHESLGLIFIVCGLAFGLDFRDYNGHKKRSEADAIHSE